MNLLFLCSQNKRRSLTAEKLFDGYNGHNVRSAGTEFLQMPIADALCSENYLVKIFAIMDRRVGKRTLQKLSESGEYKNYPEWVRQFYELRLSL